MREHGLWARSTHLAWPQGAKHSLQALWYGSKSACLASSRTGLIRREGGRGGGEIERERERERKGGGLWFIRQFITHTHAYTPPLPQSRKLHNTSLTKKGEI